MRPAQFGEQVFSRIEGLDVTRKLPGEARSTLQHCEMVAVMRNFTPFAPLHTRGVPISGPNHFHAAITDWSLYLVGRKGEHAGKVVLELPLLCIRDLAKEDLDGDELLLALDKPNAPIKSNRIAVYPLVDAARVPHKVDTKKKGKEVHKHTRADDEDDLSRPKGLLPPQPWYKTLLSRGSPNSAAHATQESQQSKQVHLHAQQQQQGAQKQQQQQQQPGAQKLLHLTTRQRQQQQQQHPSLDLQAQYTGAQQRHLQQQRLSAEEHALTLAYQSKFIAEQQLLQQRDHLRYTGQLPSPNYSAQPSSMLPTHQEQQQQLLLQSTAGAVAENVEALPAPRLPFSPTQQAYLQQHSQQNTPQPAFSSAPASPSSFLRARWPTSGPASLPPSDPTRTSELTASTPWPHVHSSPWSLATSTVTPSSPEPRSPSPHALNTQVPSPNLPPLPTHSYAPDPSPPMHKRFGLRNTSPLLSDRFTTHTLGPAGPAGLSQALSEPDANASSSLAIQPLNFKSPVLPPTPQPGVLDQWEPAPSQHGGSAVERPEEGGVYALVLLAMERKSNFFNHLRLAWIQAHLRLSISQSRLPGMPFWYTPPPSMAELLPFILTVHQKRLPEQQQQQQQRLPQQRQQQQQQRQVAPYYNVKEASITTTTSIMGSQQPPLALMGPSKAHAGVQLLQFFGYECLQDALKSTSGPSAFFNLFPGDVDALSSPFTSPYQTQPSSAGPSKGRLALPQGPTPGAMGTDLASDLGGSSSQINRAALRQVQLLRSRMVKHGLNRKPWSVAVEGLQQNVHQRPGVVGDGMPCQGDGLQPDLPQQLGTFEGAHHEFAQRSGLQYVQQRPPSPAHQLHGNPDGCDGPLLHPELSLLQLNLEHQVALHLHQQQDFAASRKARAQQEQQWMHSYAPLSVMRPDEGAPPMCVPVMPRPPSLSPSSWAPSAQGCSHPTMTQMHLTPGMAQSAPNQAYSASPGPMELASSQTQLEQQQGLQPPAFLGRQHQQLYQQQQAYKNLPAGHMQKQQQQTYNNLPAGCMQQQQGFDFLPASHQQQQQQQQPQGGANLRVGQNWHSSLPAHQLQNKQQYWHRVTTANQQQPVAEGRLHTSQPAPKSHHQQAAAHAGPWQATQPAQQPIPAAAPAISSTPSSFSFSPPSKNHPCPSTTSPPSTGAHQPHSYGSDGQQHPALTQSNQPNLLDIHSQGAGLQPHLANTHSYAASSQPHLLSLHNTNAGSQSQWQQQLAWHATQSGAPGQTEKLVLLGLLQDLAANVNYNCDPKQVACVYDAAEEVMMRGCSLFDDEDVVMLKELVLEHSLADTLKARAYARHFFNSRPTMAFIVARLYAWGSLCAMYGPAAQNEGLRSESTKHSHDSWPSATARNSQVGNSWQRAAALNDSGRDSSRQPAHKQHGYPQQQQQHQQAGASAPTCPSSYVSWVLQKGQHLSHSIDQPQGTMPDKSRPPWTGVHKSLSAQHDQQPQYDDYKYPAQHSSEMPRSQLRPSHPSSAIESQEHQQQQLQQQQQQQQRRQQQLQQQGWEHEQWKLDQQALHLSTLSLPSPQASTHLPPGGSIKVGNIWSQLLSDIPRIKAEDEMIKRTYATPPRSPAAGKLSDDNTLVHQMDPLRQSAPAVFQPSRPAIDIDSLLPGSKAVKTEDELDYELFQQLHAGHSWQAQQMVPKARHVLRRLGLNATEPTSIAATLSTVEDLALIARQHFAQRETKPGDMHSQPPPIPHTPLAPEEPLMLSPLVELPYLFSLELPAASGLDQGGRKEGSKEGVMQRWLAELEQRALQKHQAGLRGADVGHLLRDTFTKDVLDDGCDEAFEQNEAEAHWERLAGRLCAQLAWRKTRMLLHWLHNMLAFSGGTDGGRLGWLDEQIVEAGGQEQGDVWTFRQGSHHLVALLMQLRDPRGTPLLHHQQPCTSTDMLAWCRAEAGQAGQALDDCAGCLVELSNTSKEAAAKGRVPMGTGNVVADVVQQMPSHVVRTFSRRSLCRATCLLAGAAACHELKGHQAPLPELADVAAYKHCEVLLNGGLLRKPEAGVLAFIHDTLGDHVAHLIRTPQISAALDARCSDAVLSSLVSRMYKQVLSECSAAGPERRTASVYSDL